MALSGMGWIWCAVPLLCVARLGSCRTHRHDGAPHEPFIFNELCALKDESGPCKAIKDRFFFNINTRRCEVFEYGGCGGNDNNFESLEECERRCVVSDDKNPCHLPEAPGPCRGLVKRYFFDSKTQQCKHFFYGGCFGNANNFKSMAACQAKCHNPAKPSMEPEVRKPNDVQPTVLTGELTVLQPLVQHNNSNRTANECFSPIVPGSCGGEEKRYAFDREMGRCHSFNYSGCGGNGNNFLTRRQCHKTCNKRKDGVRQLIPIRRKNLDKLAPFKHRNL